MFRKYTPKDNVQKKSYYTDRFLVVPEIPKASIEDEISLKHIKALEDEIEVLEKYMQRDNVVVIVDAKDNKKALQILKMQGYTILSEMSAVDLIASKGGFEIFYQLLNISDVKRIRVKCFIEKNEAIESVEPLFRSADWSEREMYDMFGIVANNHPNLIRMLLPQDWKGHPFLKTYPLQGDEFAQWYEIDLIYGKEYRDIIGPEQRDAARVDENDTRNFARLGHEVHFGDEPSKEKVDIKYQEENGVPLVTKLDPKDSKEAAVGKSWNKRI
jgi:NADH-quinone oxidoreductase subunit C